MSINLDFLIEPLFKTIEQAFRYRPIFFVAGDLPGKPQHAGPESLGPVDSFNAFIAAMAGAGGRKGCRKARQHGVKPDQDVADGPVKPGTIQPRLR